MPADDEGRRALMFGAAFNRQKQGANRRTSDWCSSLWCEHVRRDASMLRFARSWTSFSSSGLAGKLGGAEAASQSYRRCDQPGIRSCPLPVSYSGEVVQCCRSQLMLASAGATPSAARYKLLLQVFELASRQRMHSSAGAPCCVLVRFLS